MIIFPLGFPLFSFQNTVGTLEAEAEINADIFTHIISSNPDFWEFEGIRLTEYLIRRPKEGVAELRRLVNTKNEIVSESVDDLQTPLIMRSSEIMDSGISVGRIEIYRSLRPLLGQAGVVFLLVLPMGLGVFYVLRILPIRAIFLAETALIKTNEDLETTNKLLHEEILKSQKVEAELYKLNEALETRVIERTAHLEAANRNLETHIAERKEAKKALIESEKKYRLLAEKMTDLVWTLDINLRMIYVIPSIEKMLGFSPEERVVQDLQEQLTPPSMSIVRELLAREFALEQQGQGDPERIINLEVECYHKDGSTRWIDNIISGIRDDQGVLIGFHGVSRDITNRRQMEEELRKSEKRYRELVDFLPISLFEMDMEGKITSGNLTIFKIFGYTQDDIEKGVDAAQAIIPEQVEQLKVNIQRVLNGEKIGGSEYMGVRKDGSTFPLIAFSSPIIHEGAPVGLSGAIIDLTDRKRIEESLERSNLSLAEAQRIAHIGNWEWTIERNDMYWSDEIYQIVGTTPQMFDGIYEVFSELVFPEEREIVKRAIEKAMSEGKTSEIEHRIVRRDGVVRDVRQLVEPTIDDAGKIVRVIGIVQDVTEKNQAERDLQDARDQLLQAEKLAAIGRLSAGVAHEILNPVNIISMALQILQTMESLPPEVLEELKICMSQIRRIATIAENLKQFSRISQKKRNMADINGVIAHVLTLYATQLKIDEIETKVQYQPDLPVIAMDQERTYV